MNLVSPMRLARRKPSMPRCPICDTDAEFHPTRWDGQEITCPKCGMFGVSRTALVVLERNSWTRAKKAVLSHRVRLNQSDQDPPRIDTYLMDKVLDGTLKLPTPVAQAMNALRFIADHVRDSGEALEGLPVEFSAVIGAPSHDASARVAGNLIEAGLLTGIDVTSSSGVDYLNLHPTLRGWTQYEAETRGQVATRVAIIALKFGDAQLDEFVDTVVKPAVISAGYELERVSDRPLAGVIDHVMRVKIRDAPFIIADLTHDNNGAYWEAGFAEGLGKPVIYMCHEDKWSVARTHFDTNHCETVGWHPDRSEAFQQRLVAVIRNSMADQ